MAGPPEFGTRFPGSCSPATPGRCESLWAGVPACGGAGATPVAPLAFGVQQGLGGRKSGVGGGPRRKGRLFFLIVWSVTQRYFCRAVCVCLSKTRGGGGEGGAASRRLGRFVIVQEPTKGLLRPKAERRLGAGVVLGSCCAWGARMEPCFGASERFGAGRAC